MDYLQVYFEPNCMGKIVGKEFEGLPARRSRMMESFTNVQVWLENMGATPIVRQHVFGFVQRNNATSRPQCYIDSQEKYIEWLKHCKEKLLEPQLYVKLGEPFDGDTKQNLHGPPTYVHTKYALIFSKFYDIEKGKLTFQGSILCRRNLQINTVIPMILPPFFSKNVSVFDETCVDKNAIKPLLLTDQLNWQPNLTQSGDILVAHQNVDICRAFQQKTEPKSKQFRDISSLWNNMKCSDVMFTFNNSSNSNVEEDKDVHIYCHKCILVQSSAYFANMLHFDSKISDKEHSNNILCINITEHSFDTFKALTQWIYGICPPSETRSELLIMANEFLLGDLKSEIVNKLTSEINHSNCIEMIVLASKSSSKKLYNKSLQCIVAQKESFLCQPTFKELFITHPNIGFDFAMAALNIQMIDQS